MDFLISVASRRLKEACMYVRTLKVTCSIFLRPLKAMPCFFLEFCHERDFWRKQNTSVQFSFSLIAIY